MRLVAAVFSDVHSAQPYVSTVSDQSLLTPLLTLGEFRVVVERSVPAHLPASPRLSAPSIQPPPLDPVFFITSAEEGGYVFSSVCLSVCLSVGLLANL